MTVINLRLTLLKGSGCQPVRLIGNKSPIQSECEGNMRAYYAYSSTLTTCRLSVLSAPSVTVGGRLQDLQAWFIMSPNRLTFIVQMMMTNEEFAVKVRGKVSSDLSLYR